MVEKIIGGALGTAVVSVIVWAVLWEVLLPDALPAHQIFYVPLFLGAGTVGGFLACRSS